MKIFCSIFFLYFCPVVVSAQISSLQSRIDNAGVGDTITVFGGVYEENIAIHKRLSLVGVNKPIIRGIGKGSVITIAADSVVVKGFIIEHSGSMLVDEDAGILLKSNNNTVEENDLRDVLFGIYFLGSSNNTIAGNMIVGRKFLEVGERGSGVHLWNSHHNVLSNNNITDTRDGFYIQNANFTLIKHNEVSGVRYGLHYMYADSNVFLQNKFHDNVAGAAVMYSKGITVRNNIFAHNRGFSSFGILFQDCSGMTVDSNIIADNVVGIFCEATMNNQFRHNIIAQNDVALQMFQNSTGNAFTENNFIDNLNPLWIIGKRTETRWNANGRGNYWSQYDGYDLNDDGIGDIPLKIQNVFNYLEGQYPNIRLYLYSPASQALAAASTAFPVVSLTEEEDRYPLMRAVEIRGLLTDTKNSFHLSFNDLTQIKIGLPLLALITAGVALRQIRRKRYV